MRSRNVTILFALCGSVLVVHPCLGADPAIEVDLQTRSAARALAATGAEAFANGDYQTALDSFHRAGSLVPAPTIGLMEARTLMQLGRWVEASDVYAKVQRTAVSDLSNPAFAEAVESARLELAALMPRLPRLRISVRGVNQPVQVRVDDRILPSALVGLENPQDPGPHAVEVRLASGVTEKRELSLAEGEHRDLIIEFPKPERPRKPVAVAPAPVVSAAPAPSSRSNVAGYVTLAGGGASVLVGAITGVIALGKKSDLDAACDPGCPAEMRSTLSSYRLNRTVSYVGFGLGLVGLSAGSYLLLRPSPASDQVALGLSPAGAFVTGSF